MMRFESLIRKSANRRSFLKTGIAAGAASVGAGLLSGGTSAFGQDEDGRRDDLTRGDIAILRFLNALEQIEADLWIQYSELGGTQDNEVSGVGGGNPLYQGALQILDGDMSQYIHDNTDDEISHAAFLKAYLESKGSEAVDLTPFANIPGSTATGSTGKTRLTNLMKLTVDTSFWSRYRSITNPDFDPGSPFAQAVPSLNVGQHTAIPRTDADTAGSSLSSDNTKSITTHLQAIAFTAGFHFAFIEQGGTSLYPTLAQKVTNPEVLRILLSIGPSETMHFQTWQDKAGNALPLTDVDNGPGGTGATVTFTTLANAQGETNPESLNGDTLQANLIMPEPTHFLNKKFPPVAIIRPTTVKNSGAMAAVQAFVDDGLFIGQKNPQFLRLMRQLAEEADEARRR
ncbi:MAG: ferritin-like domain-containing protein [Acidobacteria bacterium]|nr:ferritin-like domain-containing protein [Acidobacteriota bacterium]